LQIQLQKITYHNSHPEVLNPKPCAKCGEQKPYKEFYFKKDRKDYDNTCGDCRKAGRRKREATPIEENVVEPYDSSVEEPGSADGIKKMASAEIEQEEFDRAVRVFQLLKRWHDEALARGPIRGWKSISDNT